MSSIKQLTTLYDYIRLNLDDMLFPSENRDLSQSERAKYGIMDNLVRFSFGVEDFEDLKADVLQALESI